MEAIKKMILGPLKSSQAGNRLQEKHCVRSANVPASPHHQKPVESSPSRPPCSTLSLLPQTSTHQGLALPEQEDTHEEVQQVVRSLHTCSPGGPVSSYVQRRRTQDRATPRWSVQSGSQQTEPDSLMAVPAQSSFWTHPQHPTQRKEKAAG